MHVEGTETIHASIDQVWRFLTEPESVATCVPGLKSVEVITPDKEFQCMADVGLGGMRAVFAADIEWLELDAPNRASMKAHGTAPGSAVDVTSEMRLSNREGGTTNLDWTADITVVGRIASLAGRMMDLAAKKLAGQFFKCVKKKLEIETASTAQDRLDREST